jgi:adenylosuccinate lyase
LRGYSLQAWKAVQNGEDNPLEELLSSDPVLLEYLSKDETQRVLRCSAHLGDAVNKSKQLAAQIRKSIQG